MLHRSRLISLALAASVVGSLLGASLGRASGAGACHTTRSSLGGSTGIAAGVGLPAVVGGDTLVDVGGDGRRLATVVETGGAAIVRQPAASPGHGTAYVLDRRGADRVVIVTPARTIALEQPGEATQPSWSPDGRLVWSLGSRLRLWSPGRGTSDIARPRGSLDVFSPVFVNDDAIVAVTAEPEPRFTRTEDDGVDDLWRYDLTRGLWSRLTSFHARGDRFVAVRTPIVRTHGSVEFVAIAGSSARTTMPAFSLWRLGPDDTASRVRVLPREMYLAGVVGGRRAWNIYDQASGEWRLYGEVSPTRMIDLGCGAVTVDPRSVDDPDRTPPSREPATPTATPSDSPTATPTPAGDGYRSGVLVGDFSSPDAASSAAADIRAAFGGSVEVVDSVVAPNIVRPGVWAAVLLVPDGDDPLAALADLRSRMPEYQGWSWVVSV